jgi:hypothetical protein
MDKAKFYRFFRDRQRAKELRLKDATDKEILANLKIGPKRLELIEGDLPLTYAKLAHEFTHEEIISIFKEGQGEANDVNFQWFVKLYTLAVPRFANVKQFITVPSASPMLDQYIRSCIVMYANTPEAKHLWDNQRFMIDRKLEGLVVHRIGVKYLLNQDAPDA